MKVPCVTIRENTERQETVEVGGNIVAGVGPWSVLLVVVSAYAVMSSSESVLSVRLIGQLLLPMALLCGIGFEAATRRFPAGVARGALIGSMLVVVMLMASPFYFAPFGQASYGGSQLAYSPSDLASMG